MVTRKLRNRFKKKKSEQSSYAICCLHKQVIKIPWADRNPQNFLKVKDKFRQASYHLQIS
jgi:hypothetical protein